MRTFIILGWRNIWRHKRRSMVVISSIAVGIFGMLLTKAFSNSFGSNLLNDTIPYIGHIAIQKKGLQENKKGFQENGKLELTFNPDKTIIKSVSMTTKNFAPKVKLQGMVRSSETSKHVMIVGIDPAREKTVSKIHEYTLTMDGSKYLDNPEDNSILISKSMAKNLDLIIGDKLVLMLQNTKNEITGEGFIVKGIYESPFESIDKIMVYIGIKKLQKITGLGNNISEITILLKDKVIADSAKKTLITEIGNPGLEILTWKEMAKDIETAVLIFDVMMAIFFMIMFVTIIFSVANIMIMSIMERFHEIGVMKSIGTRPSRIFFMIIFESLNLCLAGLAAGIFASMIVVGILSYTGFDMSVFGQSQRGLGIGIIQYPFLNIRDIITSFIAILLTGIIAALYPARKAAKIKPLDALNFI